ncbi:hypothetical protein DB346_01495 [Verrucomicrobia bacterium LW23]|nr:hypothetical protein DB346_01495 [Verrucomicrobia bacterium LW23]
MDKVLARIYNLLIDITGTGDHFFDYYPITAKDRAWQVWCTSFGHSATAPGAKYPPDGHPEGHLLSWEKGRTLREYQLLYITEGAGRFESASCALTEVNAGTAFLLFPGEWHRYRPDTVTGWSETWIEVQGPYMEALAKESVISPRECLFRTGTETGAGAGVEIAGLFASASRVAHERAPGFQVRLGMIAMQILTLLVAQVPAGGTAGRRDVVGEAIRLLSGHLSQKISPEWVARRLHTSYSHFRRIFKEQTGLSPKAFQSQWRFRNACELLRRTDLPLKDIASRLGYDSAYHLSHAFKKACGLSPHHWRRAQKMRSSTG